VTAGVPVTSLHDNLVEMIFAATLCLWHRESVFGLKQFCLDYAKLHYTKNYRGNSERGVNFQVVLKRNCIRRARVKEDLPVY